MFEFAKERWATIGIASWGIQFFADANLLKNILANIF